MPDTDREHGTQSILSVPLLQMPTSALCDCISLNFTSWNQEPTWTEEVLSFYFLTHVLCLAFTLYPVLPATSACLWLQQNQESAPRHTLLRVCR